MIGYQKSHQNRRVTGDSPHHWLGKGVIVLAILGAIMGGTNPPREEYVHYASGKVADLAKSEMCKESDITNYLGGFGQDLLKTCETGFDLPQSVIKAVINNSTRRQNFVIFSIYTTRVLDYEYQTIGAFGNFLTFGKKS